MTTAEIAKYRLSNQRLGKGAISAGAGVTSPAGATAKVSSGVSANAGISCPAGIVSWMGAMQAQDYAMARWGIGTRLTGVTDLQVEQAVNEGAIIRTHILRPTWHLISAADIRWMLALSAPYVKAKAGSSNRQLGLDTALFNRCNTIIRNCLEGGKQLTRVELMAELRKSGIPTDENRGAHILFMAELDALVCNGARRGKQSTYALLDERVPAGKSLPREEAMALLAERYFTSHGPATVKDFAWWSGLPVKDIKNTLAALGPALSSKSEGVQTYYFAPANPEIPPNRRPVCLLPAFDEYLVSYQDRSASLSPTFLKEVITNNGLFKPVIVVNGKIAGTWSRTIKKDTVMIRLSPFGELSKTTRQGIASAAARFGRFLGLKAELSH